jgi:hypothetical protein
MGSRQKKLQDLLAPLKNNKLFHVDVLRLMRWLLCGHHMHTASVVLGVRLCRKFLCKSHVGWQGTETKRSFSSFSHAGNFCKSWAATRIKNPVLIFAVVSQLVSIFALPSIKPSVASSVLPSIASSIMPSVPSNLVVPFGMLPLILNVRGCLVQEAPPGHFVPI